MANAAQKLNEVFSVKSSLLGRMNNAINATTCNTAIFFYSFFNKHILFWFWDILHCRSISSQTSEEYQSICLRCRGACCSGARRVVAPSYSTALTQINVFQVLQYSKFFYQIYKWLYCELCFQINSCWLIGNTPPPALSTGIV